MMIKLFLVIVILVSSFDNLYGQKKTLALGLHYAVKLSQPSQLNASTNNELTNTIGISTSQIYGKKFFITTGLNYSFRNVKLSDIPHLKPFTDNFGYPFLEVVGVKDIKEKYRFLNVLLLGNLLLLESDKATNLLLSFGLEVDYIIKYEAIENSTFDGLHYSKKKGSDFENRWRPSIHAGIGVSHILSNNFIVLIKPYYLYYFLKNPAPEFRGDVNNFGISLEILYLSNG